MASHALWYGDNLVVAHHYGDGEVQLIITSTPYPGQRGCVMTGDEYLSWWSKRLEAWVPKLNEGSGVLVQNIGPMSRVGSFFNLTLFDIPRVLEAAGLFMVDVYIWDKLNAPPSGSQARTDRNEWEFAFVAARSSDYLFQPHRAPYSPKTVGKSRTGMRQSDLSGSMAGGHDRLHEAGARSSNVIRLSSSGDQNRPRVVGGSFPRKLVERFVVQYSREGDMVVDPCVGSGTTVRVAMDMGRIGVGVDSDETAIKVAEGWTGLQARGVI